MISMKGTIKDNSVVIHDETMGQRDMGWYEGRDVIVTILDRPPRRPKEDIDLSQYVAPTERGKNADQYIRELRADDRI